MPFPASLDGKKEGLGNTLAKGFSEEIPPVQELKGAAPLLGELARKLPAFWKSLPIEAKEKLHALALALPPLPENHPAHAFTEAVLDLVEREHPAHARLLEEAVESALEGRGVPWQTSQLGAFLKEQEEAP